ncbi:MAG: hypothetical protein DMF81_01355 [Acidobacteria bacterium]|nr:MAG: hypothetical protein DMF81_01355 [Acidobacteriota bacterium]
MRSARFWTWRSSPWGTLGAPKRSASASIAGENLAEAWRARTGSRAREKTVVAPRSLHRMPATPQPRATSTTFKRMFTVWRAAE